MILSKAQLREIAHLKEHKYRIEQNMFLVEGVKMVDDLLQSDYKIHSICATKDWIEEKNLSSSFPIYALFEEDLKKISNLSTPNKVVAVVEIPNTIPNVEEAYSKLTLVLDEIKDPGNMGTIIRIADWFGIENIFCSKTSVDVYNPKVIQSTMGSIFRVNVFCLDVVEFLQKKPALLPVYGTLLDGENIYSKKLDEKGLIVIGNESKGISENVQKLVTQKLYIPKFGNNMGVDSLNAAVATAIVCSEFKRNDVL